MWTTSPTFRQHTIPPSGTFTVDGLKKLSPIVTSVEPTGQCGGGPSVRISSDQLTIEPTSTPVSSTTYSDQVPFGVPYMSVDRLTFPLGVGAGAGNGSPGW